MYIQMLMLQDSDFNRSGRVINTPLELARVWLESGIAVVDKSATEAERTAFEALNGVVVEPKDETLDETPEVKPKGRPPKK